MISKRELQLNSGDGWIMRVIENRNWQALISLLKLVMVLLVWEFFANTIIWYAKAWNKHDVTTDRATLLYCICFKRKINARKVIRDNLVYTIQARTMYSHTHLCLITTLCQNVDGRIDRLDRILYLNPIINNGLILKYKVWPEGASKVSRLAFIVNNIINIPLPPPTMGRIRRYKTVDNINYWYLST